jgi:hypothetical protein
VFAELSVNHQLYLFSLAKTAKTTESHMPSTIPALVLNMNTGDDVTGPDSSKTKRPSAKYWINVGMVHGDQFFALPLGIPMDNTAAKEIPGPDSANATPEQKARKAKFRRQRRIEADLHKQVMEFLHALKPGEEREIQLVCRARMVEDKDTSVSETEEETPVFKL